MTVIPPTRDGHPDALRARGIAYVAHWDQTDKAGCRYVGHLRRVAQRLEDAGEPAEVVAAGWLHDCLEDTDVTADRLRQSGVSETTIAMVEAVTKRDGESVTDWVGRIVAQEKLTKGVIAVKRADLADNTDPARLALLDDATRKRLISKYRLFSEALVSAELS